MIPLEWPRIETVATDRFRDRGRDNDGPFRIVSSVMIATATGSRWFSKMNGRSLGSTARDRTIGSRVGTGGSSGEQYLQGAVNRNYIFRELAGIITFLIQRRHLPVLPPRLHQALRFSPL